MSSLIDFCGEQLAGECPCVRCEMDKPDCRFKLSNFLEGIQCASYRDWFDNKTRDHFAQLKCKWRRKKMLKKLVPSLDLCRRIPTGDFADSALVWIFDTQSAGKKRPEFDEDAQFFYVEDRDIAADIMTAEEWGENPPCYPAPTVAEIVEDFPYDSNAEYLSVRPDRCGSGGKFSFPWQAGCHREAGSTYVFSNAGQKRETMATLFLNMWFHIVEGVR